jgi:hypothetical protein
MSLPVYSRAEGVLWRQGQGSVLVLAPPGREVIALEGSGSVLWQLLAQPLTVPEAATRLAEFYDISVERIAEDIEPVLDELAARRLVNRTQTP